MRPESLTLGDPGWDALRQLAILLSSADLPARRDDGLHEDCRLVLAATESLITAHRAAKAAKDECLVSLIEAALFYAGRRLRAEAVV